MTKINSTPLAFITRRCAPELIVPAKPTPRELKPLSDIDNQESLRFHQPMIHIYPPSPNMRNTDLARVIREALAKVLVFYYPFAGRLKEGPCRKLMVDCTGEGVLFIEAEADVTLDQFGDELRPPFPCAEELLYDVPGSSGIIGSPLLLIQVTRLLCGGFIFALRLNHTMSDAYGLVQFLTALSEMAQGAVTPSTLPVWQRELLFARNPPRVTCAHREYDDVADTNSKIIPLDNMIHKSFFFGPNEISALRRFVPIHLQKCSTFDVLTSCIWRCRTIALKPNPEDEMRVLCLVNARAKFSPPIPIGYYGNAFIFPPAISKARDLCEKPLSHALELVMKTKSEITEEYVRSLVDLSVIKRQAHFSSAQTFAISDLTRVGFNEVDFGLGKAKYAGPFQGGGHDFPHVSTFYIPYINYKGESGVVVPISLPSVAMEDFVKELNNMLVQDNADQDLQQHKLPVLSKL